MSVHDFKLSASNLIKYIHMYPSFGFRYLYAAALVANTVVVLSIDYSFQLGNDWIYELPVVLVSLLVVITFNRRTGALTLSPRLNNWTQIFTISLIQLFHCLVILLAYTILLDRILANTPTTSPSLTTTVDSHLLSLVLILGTLTSIETHILVRSDLDTAIRASLRTQLSKLSKQIDDFRANNCSGKAYRSKLKEIQDTAEEVNTELDELPTAILDEECLKSEFQTWFSKFQGLPSPSQRKTLCICVHNLRARPERETGNQFNVLESKIRRIANNGHN